MCYVTQRMPTLERKGDSSKSGSEPNEIYIRRVSLHLGPQS